MTTRNIKDGETDPSYLFSNLDFLHSIVDCSAKRSPQALPIHVSFVKTRTPTYLTCQSPKCSAQNDLALTLRLCVFTTPAIRIQLPVYFGAIHCYE